MAVAAEELGHTVAVGPWDTGSVVAAVVAADGGAALAKEILPALADGSSTASLAVPTAAHDGSAVPTAGLTGRATSDGGLVVGGELRPVLHGSLGLVRPAPVAVSDSIRWVLLEPHGGVTVSPLPSFDPTRPLARWTLEEAVVPPGRVLTTSTQSVRDLALLVWSAEAVGGARWCLEVAAEHARTREQFGRPIGQFQGVKHRLADMLVSVEQGVAATWDAAAESDRSRSGAAGDDWQDRRDTSGRLAVQLAAALALDGYVAAAKGAIQVLGGMGFTWEHDAHIHLRRATSLRQLVGGRGRSVPERPVSRWSARADSCPSTSRPRPGRSAPSSSPRGRAGGHGGPGSAAARPCRPWVAGPTLAHSVGAGRRGGRAAGDRPGLRRGGAPAPDPPVAAWALPTIIGPRHPRNRPNGGSDPPSGAR